ncbi:hypothetical protein D9M71_694530 [compost metagenome]
MWEQRSVLDHSPLERPACEPTRSHNYRCTGRRKGFPFVIKGGPDAQAATHPFRVGRRDVSPAPQFLRLGRLQRRDKRHDVDASNLYVAGV